MLRHMTGCEHIARKKLSTELSTQLTIYYSMNYENFSKSIVDYSQNNSVNTWDKCQGIGG
ncbi:hypothetical protein U27_02377 [Candidatus Vecturithrix granuli]|uniref:Uncharacterized protein n=1 Tax=Vecturithrix granuli TaxID=1499967 RepID=A0A0S6W789_VECG1|nr:hypothetical protein U27_02377 [Candidatus Vecturithrix granuli]